MFAVTPDAKSKAEWFWRGRITGLKRSGTVVEPDIMKRGSQMHVIIGKYAYGNFVCIPEWGVGSPLASLDDQFWNGTQLAQYIGNIDAITLSEALK